MNRRDVLATGWAMLSAAALAPRPAFAYPDRVIRLVVPFSPGGATDVVGRLWAEKMKPLLGTVVTENRGGGGGVTGAAEVARAQPDGHVFLFGNTSTQVLIPAIMTNPPYDPLKDLVGICISAMPPLPSSFTIGTRTRPQGAHRLRQGQSGQAVLRLSGRRHADQSRRRAVQTAHRRARHRAHSL